MMVALNVCLSLRLPSVFTIEIYVTVHGVLGWLSW